ncbi:MAG: CinA family protein [Succinivibrionaceae bacterium]
MDSLQLQDKILEISQMMGNNLLSKNLILSTAESCTGGLISAFITEISGSSAWFDRSFITYTNKAKSEMLGIDLKEIELNGAVSEKTVISMALGALKYSDADLSVAVSGVAGPTGGTVYNPIGTVWMAWAYKNKIFKTYRASFEGNRQEIRLQTVLLAMNVVNDFIKKLNK